MVNIGNDWDQILADEWEKSYYQELREFLKAEYKEQKIYPNMYDIFNSLRYTSFKDTKVVIIGQDPYHGEGQAHGLCFSVKKGVTPPPSLKNIYKIREKFRPTGQKIGYEARFFCGFFVSSAAVAMASKPIYAKKIVNALANIPEKPFGINGVQFSGLT